MPQDSLKSKASSGVLWNAIEKFSVRFVQFIVSIVLARILLPEDFGLIGMLSIFIAISQSFIDSGMEKGLIQKKDRTTIDFSTVFVFNLAISIIFYCILFITAPYIAEFYDQPRLVLLTRVLGLNVIINSLAIVQRAKLSIDIDFKTLAKANVLSVLFGGGLGVLAAYQGYGVWSLVIKTLVGSVATVAGLWYFNYWKPSFKFSQKSFKELFNFGYKILLAGLYATGIREVYNISIGKAFTASQLGFYTRARGLAEMSAGTLTSILQQVTFPLLSSLQDDRKRMVSVYSRIIKMTAFVIFPVMTLISILAKPLIVILLTDKWIEVVPLLQWICFANIIYPISVVNMNILNAVGRSDLFLKVDLAKFPLIVITLLITVPISIKAMIIGQVVMSLISFFINAYLPGKMFGYGPIQQLKDISRIILSTLIMSVILYICMRFITGLYLQLSLGLIFGVAIYSFFSFLFKVKEQKEFYKLLIDVLNK